MRSALVSESGGALAKPPLAATRRPGSAWRSARRTVAIFASTFGWASIVVWASSVAGCGSRRESKLAAADLARMAIDDAASPGGTQVRHACEVVIDGLGKRAMESDYLPHVVQCENGRAGPAALRAQAIAARSVAYHAMRARGQICDGQRCQVYSCDKRPSRAVVNAVEATRGIYLSHSGAVTYGFYVAGDPDTSGPRCEGSPNVGTERYVTYNSGRSGRGVTQTSLGSMHAPDASHFGQNRGCMSQWGARCLEDDLEASTVDILRFYYGEDIVLRRADLSDCPPAPAR